MATLSGALGVKWLGEAMDDVELWRKRQMHLARAKAARRAFARESNFAAKEEYRRIGDEEEQAAWTAYFEWEVRFTGRIVATPFYCSQERWQVWWRPDRLKLGPFVAEARFYASPAEAVVAAPPDFATPIPSRRSRLRYAASVPEPVAVCNRAHGSPTISYSEPAGGGGAGRANRTKNLAIVASSGASRSDRHGGAIDLGVVPQPAMRRRRKRAGLVVGLSFGMSTIPVRRTRVIERAAVGGVTVIGHQFRWRSQPRYISSARLDDPKHSRLTTSSADQIVLVEAPSSPRTVYRAAPPLTGLIVPSPTKSRSLSVATTHP